MRQSSDASISFEREKKMKEKLEADIETNETHQLGRFKEKREKMEKKLAEEERSLRKNSRHKWSENFAAYSLYDIWQVKNALSMHVEMKKIVQLSFESNIQCHYDIPFRRQAIFSVYQHELVGHCAKRSNVVIQS